MRQPACAFGIISCPVCSRSSHLESGALFPFSLFLAVIVPGVWVCFRGCSIWFDSGYMFCDSCVGGFGRISHIFYVAADSDPEAFFLRSV